MSRVIKFRAFDTQRNVMYSAAELGRDEMQLHPDGRGFFNASSVSQRLSQYYSHLLPMQFVGLHDKNGREIYEGDIFRLEGWLVIKAVVIYHEACWCLRWNDGSFGNLRAHVVTNSGEVIGNVHQNPELLQ